MRQFPLTLTDQVPFRLPPSSWRLKPGRFISLGDMETLNRPKTNRKRSACLAWTPDLMPLVKNFSKPLCLKFVITKRNVTYIVTTCKRSNGGREPRRRRFSDNLTNEGKDLLLRYAQAAPIGCSRCVASCDGAGHRKEPTDSGRPEDRGGFLNRLANLCLD